ncbi:MAG: hypothetical protein ABIS86_00060 [Streptosporangiaceae bacterium]
MFRTLLVVPLLAVSLVACGGSKDAVQPGSDPARSATATAAATMSTGASAGSSDGTATNCPAKATKSFAKTRFVADAGLAFGAFNQWILKPFRRGSFKSGASGRTTAIVKAGAAGLFAVNRLNAARKLVSADPTLCTYLKAPFDSMTNAVNDAITKLKSGDTSAITGAGTSLEGLRKAAQDAGVNIKDKSTGF